MVRIHLPPAASPLRTGLSGAISPTSAYRPGQPGNGCNDFSPKRRRFPMRPAAGRRLGRVAGVQCTRHGTRKCGSPADLTHDVVLSPPNDPEPTQDAKLPGTAIMRFVSARGHRTAVELIYEKRLIEAETSRESLNELGLSIGDKCTISLRLPRVYAKREAEKQTGIAERAAARRRFRKRQRA